MIETKGVREAAQGFIEAIFVRWLRQYTRPKEAMRLDSHFGT
jgi:hypothetical protein